MAGCNRVESEHLLDQFYFIWRELEVLSLTPLGGQVERINKMNLEQNHLFGE